MKAKSKCLEFEYVRWNDNLSEMKHFCGEQCTITYESCHIDDYFSLKVYDDIQHRDVLVPLGHYVMKYDDMIFIVDPLDFNAFFENIEDKITAVDSNTVHNDIKNKA